MSDEKRMVLVKFSGEFLTMAKDELDAENILETKMNFIGNKYTATQVRLVHQPLPDVESKEVDKEPMSKEEKSNRARAFIDLVQEIVDDPDFEEKAERMCPGMYELTDEQWNRRFTI